VNTVASLRGEIPWYVAVLAAWRTRSDTQRDALWAGAVWAARTVEFARQHPHDKREIARLQDVVLAKVSEETAAVLLVMNTRRGMRDQEAKAAPGTEPTGVGDRGRPRMRERQWLIPR
jgi:ribonuclease D